MVSIQHTLSVFILFSLTLLSCKKEPKPAVESVASPTKPLTQQEVERAITQAPQVSAIDHEAQKIEDAVPKLYTVADSFRVNDTQVKFSFSFDGKQLRKAYTSSESDTSAGGSDIWLNAAKQPVKVHQWRYFDHQKWGYSLYEEVLRYYQNDSVAQAFTRNIRGGNGSRPSISQVPWQVDTRPKAEIRLADSTAIASFKQFYEQKLKERKAVKPRA